MSLVEARPAPNLVTTVPPKKPLSLLKMMEVSRDNGMAAIPEAAYDQPVYELTSIFGSLYIVSDPAGVERVLLDNVANYPKGKHDSRFLAAAFGDGLLTSDGDKWRRHRRIMAPSFDHRSIVAYAPAMVETTDRFIAKWNNLPDDAVVDIAAEMTALTLQLISRTMFSSDSDEMAELVGKTLAKGMGEMDFGLLDILPGIGP